MSLSCLQQINRLISIFDLPSHKLCQWINACYCEYPLQSIKYIRKLMLNHFNDDVQLNIINKIIESGVIPQILKLLTKNSYTLLMLCYGYIRKLHLQYEIPTEIINSIHLFCIIDHSTDYRLQTEIKWILSFIAGGTADHTQYIVKNGAMPIIMPQMVENCYCDDNDNDILIQFMCTKIIRKLLSIDCDPPIQSFIDLDIVPRLIQILLIDQDNPYRYQLQIEAAWCLTNISSGTAENVAVVIRYGAVPILVKLLHSKCNGVKEQVIWALGNIAGDSPECRNLVLSHGALSNLLPILLKKDCKLNILRIATWTVSNMCRGRPSPEFKYIKQCLKALSIMIRNDDTEILQDTCWGFSYLTDSISSNTEEEQQYVFQMIVNNDSLIRLIQLLDHKSPFVSHPALRNIGNIVTGSNDNDDYRQKTINLGLLKKLYALIQKTDRLTIKREACWTISNITAGSFECIQQVIDCNLFEPLIDILQNNQYEIAKEALWAISNATSGGTDQQIVYLVNHGVIKPLCQFIANINNKSHKMLLVAMEAIENILAVGRRLGNDGCNEYASYVEESGGVNYLESIQSDQSVPEDVYYKAFTIIKEYYDGEEESNDDVMGITTEKIQNC